MLLLRTRIADSSTQTFCSLVSKGTDSDRFYYGDQRKADGTAVYNAIDGDGHAKLYLELAEGKTQGPWQQTFVSGTGYKDFSAI